MNLNSPFFSVVIPVYNKEKYVSRSIQSVINQTFDNFEIIIVNDASNDNSMDVVRSFDDPRIRVFNRDTPGPGGYAARNLGITHSRGIWIAFLDADDKWDPDHLESMYKLSCMFPDARFMAAGSRVINGHNIQPNAYWACNEHKGPHLISLSEYLSSCLDNKRPVRTGTACIKNDKTVVTRLFPDNMNVKRGGDLYAWLKLMCHYKQMAWSNHLGENYYKDIPGQVVKVAPTSISLMGHDVYNEFSRDLKRKEKRLLAKYLNYWLFKVWKRSPTRYFSSLMIIKNLYWKRDPLFSLFVSILIVMPRKLVFSVWRAIKYWEFKV